MKRTFCSLMYTHYPILQVYHTTRPGTGVSAGSGPQNIPLFPKAFFFFINFFFDAEDFGSFLRWKMYLYCSVLAFHRLLWDPHLIFLWKLVSLTFKGTEKVIIGPKWTWSALCLSQDRTYHWITLQLNLISSSLSHHYISAQMTVSYPDCSST